MIFASVCTYFNHNASFLCAASNIFKSQCNQRSSNSDSSAAFIRSRQRGPRNLINSVAAVHIEEIQYYSNVHGQWFISFWKLKLCVPRSRRSRKRSMWPGILQFNRVNIPQHTQQWAEWIETPLHGVLLLLEREDFEWPHKHLCFKYLSCLNKKVIINEMRVHSYLVRMPKHFNRKYLWRLPACVTNLSEGDKVPSQGFRQPQVAPHLLSRDQNNIRSQASRTSHLKTSFWERGTELNNALRMSITSSQVCRSSLPAKSRFQVSHFFCVLSLYACYALVFAITPQGSNVDLRFVNNDVWFVVFAYSFREVRTEELRRKPWSSWTQLVPNSNYSP